MAEIFVATSRGLASWGHDVGISKHIYKLGVADGSAVEAVQALADTAFAGETDWQLLHAEPTTIDEATAIAGLAKRETVIDPRYYPKIKDGRGVFKVKPDNVERHFLVKKALEGTEERAFKVKPGDIGAYLVLSAQR